jgi:SAM-dependent methyltransferase
MDGNELYHIPETVRFYDLENGGARGDFDFCMQLAGSASSVLDLGCGTGQLTAALAEGGRRDVFGVDPAGPMLDVARARPGGHHVTWVREDARVVRLGRRFDLIVMTGHAFQVFLTGEDRLAVLKTVATHLSPGGRFVLDTRNPACREWEEWTPERSRLSLHHAEFGDVTVWNEVERDSATGMVTYQTHYEVPGQGQHYSASARIAFPEREEVETLVAEAGLRVNSLLSDWQGSPWHANAREIVVVGDLA